MQVSIQTETREALRALDRASGETKAGIRRALSMIGAVVKHTAVRYAPISPTSALLRKLGKGNKQGTPGGLMRSITFASDAEKTEVFVPSNSEAGKYARKMHDEKGLSWWRRGPGTAAKGPQADHKFILRAIQDEEGTIGRIVDDEMEKVT